MRGRGLLGVLGPSQSASREGRDVGVRPLLAHARREQTGGLVPPVAKAADRVMKSAWGAAILGAGRRPYSVPLSAGDRRALAPFSGRRFGFLTGSAPARLRCLGWRSSKPGKNMVVRTMLARTR